MSHIVVSATAVRNRVRIATPLAQLLKDLSRPPVEMGVDNPHGVYRQIIAHPTLRSVRFSGSRFPSSQQRSFKPMDRMRRTMPRRVKGAKRSVDGGDGVRMTRSEA